MIDVLNNTEEKEKNIKKQEKIVEKKEIENKDEKQKIEERKEKIKNWLKDPYNLALLGILIFAFAIRLYYFFLTRNQPLWWDETRRFSSAKKILVF